MPSHNLPAPANSVELLVRVRALLTPDRWIKGTLARDADGEYVSNPQSDRAEKFCLIGGVSHAAGEVKSPYSVPLSEFNRVYEDYLQHKANERYARAALVKAIHSYRVEVLGFLPKTVEVEVFNDRVRTKWTDIRAVLTRAIALEAERLGVPVPPDTTPLEECINANASVSE